jgi:uncharacterized protein (DUF2062 family)
VNRFLGALRERVRKAVGADEPAERVAAAWALGVAIAFSPLLGLHTLIALLFGFAFRLNKPDIVAGTFVINPWTLPFYFPAAVFLGRHVTGVRIPHADLPSVGDMLSLAWDQSDKDWVKAMLTAWSASSAILAVLIGLVTFLVLRRLIEAHRRHHPHRADA